MRGFITRLLPSRSPKGVVGIGIQSGKLALVHVSGLGGAAVLHAADVLTASTEQRPKALAEWVASRGLSGAPATLILEQGAYGLFQADKPAVEGGEMRAAVRWKIKSFIDYPPDQAVVDVFDVPEGRRGESNTVYVVAARRVLLKERVELIKQSGLKLKRIDILELALRNLSGVMRIDGDNEALALLYFQEQSGWLVICRQSQFYLARNLDYGTRQLNAAPQADEMTIDDTDMMDRVSLEVQRTMDYYDSHFGRAPIKRVAVFSETGRLDALVAHVQTGLGVQAKSASLEDFVRPGQDFVPAESVPGWVLGGALGELE